MNDLIDEDTYKKWYHKFKLDRSLIEVELRCTNLSKSDAPLKKMKEAIPLINNLRGIYEMATLSEKHAFISEVFKGKLMYEKGSFRTPCINPLFGSD